MMKTQSSAIHNAIVCTLTLALLSIAPFRTPTAMVAQESRRTRQGIL